MTQEMKEKIRDTLSIAYQIGFTHKSAGNMAYLEVDTVLDALMDSIVIAEKTEIPKPDHIAEVPAEVKEDIVWRDHHNGEYGCIGCICGYCAHRCGEGCQYSGAAFNCAAIHSNEVVKECKYFEEME